MKYSFKTDQVLKCQNEWRSIHFFPEYKIDLNVIELNVGGMCILSCEQTQPRLLITFHLPCNSH